jgi:protease I
MAMSKRILIVTGDGGESYETLYALHRFQEAGLDPVISAPTARPLHLVMHDFEPGWDTYVERPGYRADATLALDEVKVDDFHATLLIGGRAPEYLRNNDTLLQIVRTFHEQKKWIYSICHGVQILVAAGLVKGRDITCYEHVKCEVEQAGGQWIGEEAHLQDRIISGQTWQSHPDFYRLIFQNLDS